MSDMYDRDLPLDPPILVSIGDAKGNVISVQVLAEVARIFHEPDRFGWYLAKALTKVSPKGPRGAGK